MIIKVLGLFILTEAIVSLWWPNNDKEWYAQVVRVLRIVCGVIMI